MAREIVKRRFIRSVVAALTLAVALALAVPAAFADESTEAELSQLQAQIESSAQDYDQATAHIAELQQAMVENQARIDEINEQIPQQTARCVDSARTLYVMQQEGYGLIEMILSSESLADFLEKVDYMDLITQHNTNQIEKLGSMRDELQATQEQLDKDEKDAEEAATRAERALEQAKASRQAAQEKALAEAARQLENQKAIAQQVADELAAQQQAEAAAVQQAQPAQSQEQQQEQQQQPAQQQASEQQVQEAQPAEEPAGVNAENTESPVAQEQPEPEAQGSVSGDQVSWDSDRDAFIAQWSGRIDAYLAGSPLAGQGATFAAAAWDYGVDPRWSPAISCAESSKGAVCFLPYNAWGWGSSSWGSWEEAINAHVAGLAHGYGSTLTYEAAARYCPPNANHWYNTVLAQMNSI